MLIKPKKTERQIAKQKLRKFQSVFFQKTETVLWVKRLFAVMEYEKTGRSVVLERESRHLGIPIEQVIDLYHHKLAGIKIPKLEKFTDNLLD